MDGIYLVKPPRILEEFGLVQKETYWKLNKVLYGLRSGPKKWGDHRDEVLKRMVVTLPKEDGSEVKGKCEQCTNCANIWKVIDLAEEKV